MGASPTNKRNIHIRFLGIYLKEHMELSLFLAKAIGITLVAISSTMLLNSKNIDLLFDLYSHPEVVFLTGIVETIVGIMFVLSHNVWTLDVRGVLTIIAWIVLIRGIERTLFPSRVPELLKKFKQMRSTFVPLLVFIFFVGAYLTYAGFTS